MDKQKALELARSATDIAREVPRQLDHPTALVMLCHAVKDLGLAVEAMLADG